MLVFYHSYQGSQMAKTVDDIPQESAIAPSSIWELANKGRSFLVSIDFTMSCD